MIGKIGRKASILFLTLILILSLISGCASSTTKSEDAAMAVTRAAASYGDGDTALNYTSANSGAGVTEVAQAKGVPTGGTVTANDSVNNAILAERKIIRSANVTVEVDNFDEAYGRVSNAVLGIGFIQETNINSEKVYVDGKETLIKNGTIVIRVDKEKFDSVLNNIKGIGRVYNWTINGQDVTDKYVDVESRLRILRLEESRLEEYLKKLTDIDQIFKTESRLTEIRTQIESLTVNLKKMSDLVELSTITIHMNEKNPAKIDSGKPLSFGQKLLNRFVSSLKGVANFLTDLLIVLIAALPVLILIGAFIFLITVIYRRFFQNKSRKAPVSYTPYENKEKQKEENENK